MPHRSRPLIWGWAAAGLALTALLAACGGGSSGAKTTPTTATPASPAASAGSTGNAGSGTPPGAFGTVAAITGTQMEVQNQQSGQVTVMWTPSTTFSRTSTVPATAVTTGVCVTAIGTKTSGTLTARTVAISQPSASGSCGLGRRITSGTRPPGSPPRTFAPRKGTNNLAGMAFAGGKVTSVSATDMVLSGYTFSGQAPGSTPSTPPTSTHATSVTVGLSSSTTYTETQAATASNLAVGDCVTANGTTSSTGSVTARRIAITSTSGGSCTTGGGFFRFGGGTANG
jgi:hypothetical protein